MRKIAIEKRNKTNLIKKLFPQSASILGRQRRSIAKYFSLLSRCEFPLLRFLHFTCVCTIPGRAVHSARERKRTNEIEEERQLKRSSVKSNIENRQSVCIGTIGQVTWPNAKQVLLSVGRKLFIEFCIKWFFPLSSSLVFFHSHSLFIGCMFERGFSWPGRHSGCQ